MLFLGMAKRTKKKKKSVDKEVLNQIAHLETLLKYSRRVVDGTSEQLDELFSGQCKKLEGLIKKLKESNGLR